MKSVFSFFVILLLSSLSHCQAQATGAFQVKGNINTYYPVVFYDGGYDNNAATELEIGRSQVHEDGSWRGSFTAKIRFHTNNNGNAWTGAFIHSDIQTNNVWTFIAITTFIGGYQDASDYSNDKKIVIWLRGGTTTYHYKSNYTVNPTVYDGVQNAITYTATNGPSFTSKTTPDPSINQNGSNYNAFNGSNTSLYTSRIVIGATAMPANSTYKLDVYGTARINKVVVNTTGADFVFDSSYQLRSLDSVEIFIQQNKHLPEIEPAADMQREGVDLGSNQTKLLQKIEELTLYLIEQKKELSIQKRLIEDQQQQVHTLERKIKLLQAE